ncbi:SAM-dependent methyltransferase [Intrasporangium oryzae NRRL B-24470]|uniref:SAM-dependent methyltransferase n=1 Tax=Intrasporangium oryzae NRRL B-24470 TaxID=1386089 RepID=W9GEK8_9MICO|nr:methyltransferase [Intrasporangium oryzae]EWT03652.1 SAM-dependent methyltransferase [Intrasporangium oryzae NRRL B-24470]
MTDAPVVDPVLLARLRDDLEAARFTVDGVAERLGPVASAALHREQSLPARLVTDGAADACATLVRLLTLGEPVPSASVAAALPTLGLEGARALGLIAPAPAAGDPSGSLRATCDLRPYADDAHDWWVASDLSEIATRAPLRPDHVLGIGGASTTLASWTVRRPVDRALDLGTGCGVQALHLAGHSRTIVATDISRRALAYAALNAALAGIDLDLRLGDMLTPVAGERFGLVVSNPPFVITPRTDDLPLYEYRDGGRAGDAVVRSLVREVGSVLELGGIAQFLGNWEIPAGRTWRDVWADWLGDPAEDGVALDAWVIQREQQDPAEYAELWSRDGGTVPGSPAHDRMYAAWLRDFAARGVESVGFGVVTLQRPLTDRAPWHDLVEWSGPVAPAMGPTIDAGLRARTWLAEHSDDDLLDIAWSCAPDVTEERHGPPGAGDPSVIVIRQGGGLGRVVRAGTVLAAYLGVADGELTAGAALDAIATVLDVDADAVRAEVVPAVRELVADGLLV